MAPYLHSPYKPSWRGQVRLLAFTLFTPYPKLVHERNNALGLYSGRAWFESLPDTDYPQVISDFLHPIQANASTVPRIREQPVRYTTFQIIIRCSFYHSTQYCLRAGCLQQKKMAIHVMYGCERPTHTCHNSSTDTVCTLNELRRLGGESFAMKTLKRT